MNNWQRPFLAELVGTFFLVFIGAGSIVVNHHTGGDVGLVGIALAHGLALSVAVTALGPTSGGHFNPAVSIALTVFGKLERQLLGYYVAAQLVGGSIAGILLKALYPAASTNATNLGTPALAADVTLGQGILIEVILTFLLITAIYGTAVDSRAPKIGGFGIGLTVAFDILAGGPLTGAAMNPARVFGTAVAQGFWADHWVYWVGPVLGALAGGYVYERYVLEKAGSPSATPNLSQGD